MNMETIIQRPRHAGKSIMHVFLRALLAMSPLPTVAQDVVFFDEAPQLTPNAWRRMHGRRRGPNPAGTKVARLFAAGRATIAHKG
jgi:hypothetical protein